MTGLNMESFLRLLRADLGAWVSLGAIAVVLALMTWTSWGSRRALWKCLVLSVVVHLGLLLYGGAVGALLHLLKIEGRGVARPVEVVERVRISPVADDGGRASGVGGTAGRKVEAWDRDRSPLALAETEARTPRPEPVAAENSIDPPQVPEPLAAETVMAEAGFPDPVRPEPVATAPIGGPEIAPDLAPVAASEGVPDVAPGPRPVDPAPAAVAIEDLRARMRRTEVAAARPPNGGETKPGPPVRGPVVDPADSVAIALPDAVPFASGPRTMPEPMESLPPGPALEPPIAPAEVETSEPSPRVAPSLGLPEVDLRRAARPTRAETARGSVVVPPRLRDEATPIAMARVTPTGPNGMAPMPRPEGRRSLANVPTVYRSRLDPNRTTLAQRAGASVASEQAVERALDWLARHQDADGRWDAATAKTREGVPLAEDDAFTVHCPPGDVCFGECFYWEADTALTGLSLLAYLGSGYTHVDGKHAQTVSRGLDYLLRSQKGDGDLRGPSVAVGMYCHAMATLALAEAYALTGDARLKGPVERGVGFLVRSRAQDGLAWRYAPDAPVGDTSILGWAVMAMKTGKMVGVAVPDAVAEGTQGWLKKVAAGQSGGLARYMPWQKVTATMTAEAWACRQFLGFGGPGPESDEAASFLLQHGPDRDPYNIYYWYYGTLAMYQRGGPDWAKWNGQVRDQVVLRQRTEGHKAGSWDPDESEYGTYGGRVYATALATLTLEVYYRYLRLYESTPDRPTDPGARRAGAAGR